VDAQAELPVESDPARPPDVTSPEFGFSLMAALTTIRKIQADIVMIKAFLVKIAPLLDALKTAMGQASPFAPGEMQATVEQFKRQE
jgi:hypothetical protein